MVRIGVQSDSSSGIRIWSKASLIHFTRDPATREFLAKPPSGGFVQVTPSPANLLLHSVNANWHALGSDDDVAAASQLPTRVPAWQHYVELGELNDAFLSFCNHIAWPIQHGLTDQLSAALEQFDLDELWRAYVAGSEIYARELASKALPGETQLLHDNHLWLVPGMVRALYPSKASRIPIGLFIHTPHGDPAIFEKFLGRARAKQTIASMDAADCVMFQSDQDMRNFSMCRDEFLGAVENAELRATHVVLDPEEVEQVAGLRSIPNDLMTLDDERALYRQRRHARYGMRMVESAKRILGPGSKVIVGSMRLDPAKGVLEFVQSLAALIMIHPEYLGKIHVIIRTPESRKYHEYRREVDAAIALANERYLYECKKRSIEAKMPLIRRYKLNSRGAAIGSSRFADVAVYPSLADGYNISALEAAIASDAAAIVIGESAGVTKTLGTDCFTCDPSHIEELAATLHIALSLTASDRQDRLNRMRSRVKYNSKVQWLLARAREVNAAYWRHNNRATDNLSATGTESAIPMSSFSRRERND